MRSRTKAIQRVALGVVTAVVSLLLACAVLSWLGRQMLFPAPGAPPRSAALGRSDVSVVVLPGGTEAFYLPARTARTSDSEARGSENVLAPVLIHTHGNGELVDDWLDEFEEPRSWGIAVLLVEYPGYGRSAGSPSEKTITRTMAEAHDWILQREDLDPARIVAYGRSLGGGAAASLAGKRKIAALILESTFSSVTELARGMGAPGFLVLDPFDNLRVVRDFPGPILGIHGTSDRLIPYSHALELKASARDYRLLRLECGHNDCPRQWSAVKDFLRDKQLLPVLD